MRNRKSIDVISITVTLACLAALAWHFAPRPPEPDKAIHAALGRALARETLQLLPPGGEVLVIGRTEAFPQPALDIAIETFEKEVRKAKAVPVSRHLVEVDPLKSPIVPAGTFFELLRRSNEKRVVVSFLGPPLLTAEQVTKLGPIKAKVVAFCSGSSDRRPELAGLARLGLLHAAVIDRREPAAPRKPGTVEGFDQLYTVLKEGQLALNNAGL